MLASLGYGGAGIWLYGDLHETHFQRSVGPVVLDQVLDGGKSKLNCRLKFYNCIILQYVTYIWLLPRQPCSHSIFKRYIVLQLFLAICMHGYAMPAARIPCTASFTALMFLLFALRFSSPWTLDTWGAPVPQHPLKQLPVEWTPISTWFSERRPILLMRYFEYKNTIEHNILYYIILYVRMQTQSCMHAHRELIIHI